MLLVVVCVHLDGVRTFVFAVLGSDALLCVVGLLVMYSPGWA